MSRPSTSGSPAYADAHGLPLVVLHVYTIGALVYPVMPYPIPPYPVVEEMERFRAEALRTAEHSLGRWTEKYSDVDVRTEVTEGPAARELVTPVGVPACSSSGPAATVAWPACCSVR